MQTKPFVFILACWLLIGMTGCEKQDIPASNSTTQQPVYDDGLLPGRFSVGRTGKIRFAQGNLQYQASTGIWRLAAHQYDYVGDNKYGNVVADGAKCDNANISSTYAGWIDLFGWGTSGWNSGATAFQPFSVSTKSIDYCPGGSIYTDLAGQYANADWGVYNKISNGGNQAGLWHTLSYDELYYLLAERYHADSLKGLASIQGHRGFLLLPDDWEIPDGLTFVPRAGSCERNSYSYNEWIQMELAGAVFLPFAGRRRYGTTIEDAGINAYYWTTTSSKVTAESGWGYMSVWNLCVDDQGSGYMWFGNNFAARSNGYSVRLVQTVK